MIGIKRLNVQLHLGNDVVEVGELVADKQQIYFRYTPSFIERGLQLSPYKLPLTTEIVSAGPIPFDGLFGLFNDSLPDGWGRLLLDRKLTTKGIAIGQITPLDRLAYIGQNGMGALTYYPVFENESQLETITELDQLASEMNKLLDGTSSDILDELYQLGGSSGGARPKIVVGYNQETDHLIYGKDQLPDGYEHWLIKFPASVDRIDVAHIEYAYYLMARDAGIEMSESRLFKGKTDRYYFGTKRFDRMGNQRVHLHSASGLLHDNFRLSNLDYGHLMDAAFRLENHVNAYNKILRLATFNVFSHNRDDHSKNFAFLMNSSGSWRFAPAYDLTFSSSSHGFHSTMVAGEGLSLDSTHLLKLAGYFSMKHPERIVEQVRDTLSNWKTYAKDAGVSRESIELIQRSTDRMK